MNQLIKLSLGMLTLIGCSALIASTVTVGWYYANNPEAFTHNHSQNQLAITSR